MVTIGLGRFSPASRMRIPRPPQNRTTFMKTSFRRTSKSSRGRPTAQMSRTRTAEAVSAKIAPRHRPPACDLDQWSGLRLRGVRPNPDNRLPLGRLGAAASGGLNQGTIGLADGGRGGSDGVGRESGRVLTGIVCWVGRNDELANAPERLLGIHHFLQALHDERLQQPGSLERLPELLEPTLVIVPERA